MSSNERSALIAASRSSASRAANWSAPIRQRCDEGKRPRSSVKLPAHRVFQPWPSSRLLEPLVFRDADVRARAHRCLPISSSNAAVHRRAATLIAAMRIRVAIQSTGCKELRHGNADGRSTGVFMLNLGASGSYINRLQLISDYVDRSEWILLKPKYLQTHSARRRRCLGHSGSLCGSHAVVEV